MAVRGRVTLGEHSPGHYGSRRVNWGKSMRAAGLPARHPRRLTLRYRFRPDTDGQDQMTSLLPNHDDESRRDEGASVDGVGAATITPGRGEIARDPDVLEAMSRLVDAASSITGAAEAGIVIVDSHGTLQIVASTSERMKDVEEVQIGAFEGPCVTCFETGEPVSVADISATAAEWPRYSEVAAERGLKGAQAVPLRIGDELVGVLCLMSTETGAFEPRDVGLATALGTAAAQSLLSIDRHAQNAERLQRALDSRIVIEQAKAILAAKLDVSLAEAFTRLRGHARSRNASLREVAQTVVDSLPPA